MNISDKIDIAKRRFLKGTVSTSMALAGGIGVTRCAPDNTDNTLNSDPEMTEEESIPSLTDPLYKLDATAQANLVKSGELSAFELMETTLNRIEKLNPVLNFLAGYDFDKALSIAKTHTSEGPFSGVPTLLKDTISYPGLRYSMGSRIFSKRIAEEGSDYTDRLDKSGLITIGKSTTSEFAMLGSVETALEGVTKNPWDLDRSPAGSSGGSAAAVASGAVPIAHASDGGGSIRIPSCVTGLFGFKPSSGRNVSDTPNDIKYGPLQNIVAQHCISRSVRDSAQYLHITERKGSDAILPPVGFVNAPINRPLRIGFYTTTLSGAAPEADVLRAVEQTAALCADLGHEIIPCPPPNVDAQEIGDTFYILAGHQMSALETLVSQNIGRRVDESMLEPYVLSLIEWYRSQPKDAVEKAMVSIENSAKIVSSFLSDYDVCLCPTLPVTARPLGHFEQKLGFEEITNRLEAFAGYTPIHNQAGVPAMSVPLFWTDDGLPVGSHFAAQHGQEALLFALAYQLEETKPWAEKWPAIAL